MAVEWAQFGELPPLEADWRADQVDQVRVQNCGMCEVATALFDNVNFN